MDAPSSDELGIHHSTKVLCVGVLRAGAWLW